MSSEQVPQRLSDVERDEAAGMLRKHYEAGRIDDTEFGERLSVVLAAKYSTDFGPVFADLPDPHPGRRGVAGVPFPGAPVLPPYAAPPRPPAHPVRWTPPPPPVDGAGPASGLAQYLPIARNLLWPVAIVMALVTGNWFLWIMLAVVGGIVLRQLGGNHRKPPPYLEQ